MQQEFGFGSKSRGVNFGLHPQEAGTLGTWCGAQTCWHRASPCVYVASFTGEQTGLFKCYNREGDTTRKEFLRWEPMAVNEPGANKPSCVHLYFYKLIRIETVCGSRSFFSRTFSENALTRTKPYFWLRDDGGMAVTYLWVHSMRLTLRFICLTHVY